MYIVFKYFENKKSNYYWSGSLWVNDKRMAKIYEKSEAVRIAKQYLGQWQKIQ